MAGKDSLNHRWKQVITPGFRHDDHCAAQLRELVNPFLAACIKYVGSIYPKITKGQEVTSMPIFDYHCQDCGTTYEIFHKVREKAEDIVCPKCGSTHSKKQISAPAVSVGSLSSTDSGSQNYGGGGCASGMCGLN